MKAPEVQAADAKEAQKLLKYLERALGKPSAFKEDKPNNTIRASWKQKTWKADLWVDMELSMSFRLYVPSAQFAVDADGRIAGEFIAQLSRSAAHLPKRSLPDDVYAVLEALKK